MSTRLPGFRFYPTEEELLQFYLRNKLDKRRPEMERIIPVVDVYNHDQRSFLKFASEDVGYIEMSGEESVQDPEQWFFFCPRQEKEAQGGRPTRSTRSGYWKATGSPTQVIHNNRVIGIRKTMVFYEGRAPHGRKTSWKMNEYKAYKEPCTSDEALKLRSEFSLCRVYKRSGCLRSFDRRPTVATAETSATADDVDRSVSTAGTSSYQGDPTMAMETQLSPGSSMSTDPYVPGEGIEGELALEELDWNFLFGYDESLA